MEGTIKREYKYNKNGKTVTIKREYTVKGDRKIKSSELDKYFKDNIEILTGNKKLKDIVEEYNNNHSSHVSYSMFYQKYKNVFGFRKNHKNKPEIKPEQQPEEKPEIKPEIKQEEKPEIKQLINNENE